VDLGSKRNRYKPARRSQHRPPPRGGRYRPDPFWRVDPEPGSLSWAEGAVPTSHGDITVKWASGPGGFRISIQAPGHTTGTVVLPKGVSRYSVTVNGRIVPVSSDQAAVRVG
jgi:hypothetical protein